MWSDEDIDVLYDENDPRIDWENGVIEPLPWQIPVGELEETLDSQFVPLAPPGMSSYYIGMQCPQLAEFYKGNVVDERETPLKGEEAALAVSVASKSDHAIAAEMIGGIHPELLEIALTTLIGRDPFDFKDPKNQLRMKFISAFESGQITVPKHLADGYMASLEAGYINLYDKYGTILFRGLLGELIEYVRSFCPGILTSVLEEFRDFEFSTTTDFETVLSSARAVRRVCRSLDNFTKVSQLPMVEYDHVFYRYGSREDGTVCIVNDSWIHALRFDVVLNLTTEEFLALDSPPQCDMIFINCVKGKETSDQCVNDDRLVRKAAWYKDTHYIRLYIAMLGSPDIKVTKVRKSRPHNNLITVEIDDYGQYFEQLSVIEQDSARRANEVRNARFTGMQPPVNYLLPSVDGFDIDLIYNAAKKKNIKVPGQLRDLTLKHQVKATRRSKELMLYARDSAYMFDPGMPHVKLKRFGLKDRRLHLNDIGILSPDTVFRSIGIWCKEHGKELVFDGIWTAV